SHLGGYTFRHAQEEVRVHDNLRRIRPRALMPSDTVTDLPALNALAHLGDRPRALNSDDMRILHPIHTRTTVRIDEIHTRSLNVDEHLTGARLRSLDLTELKDLRSTSLHGTNCPEED